LCLSLSVYVSLSVCVTHVVFLLLSVDVCLIVCVSLSVPVSLRMCVSQCVCVCLSLSVCVLAVIRKLGLERIIYSLVDRLNLVFPGAGIRGGIVDGFQAGAGDGDVAFSVGVVLFHKGMSGIKGW